MKLISTILFSAFSSVLFAQKEHDTIYFDKNWAVTNVMDSASYYRIVRETEGLYRVWDYYIETDTLQMTGAFKDAEQKIKEGLFVYYKRIGGISSEVSYKDGKYHGKTRYYTESGKLYYSEDFSNGIRHGDFMTYHENGNLKRKEAYDQGELITKACYLQDGTETGYFPYEVPASYSGGMEGIKQFLRQNIRYPKAAWKKGITGKVYVQLVISDKGKVSYVKVKQSAHPLLDKEAVRVVESMSGWKPGMIDGKPVNSSFSLPISFNLN